MMADPDSWAQAIGRRASDSRILRKKDTYSPNSSLTKRAGPASFERSSSQATGNCPLRVRGAGGCGAAWELCNGAKGLRRQ